MLFYPIPCYTKKSFTEVKQLLIKKNSYKIVSKSHKCHLNMCVCVCAKHVYESSPRRQNQQQQEQQQQQQQQQFLRIKA